MSNTETLPAAALATLTASEYAAKLNADTRAWVAANPGAWAMCLMEGADDWAECDVHTGLDLAVYLARGEYSDTHKEAYGVRPSLAWLGGLSKAEALEALRAALPALYEAARRAADDWAAWEAHNAAMEREAAEAAAREAVRAHEERFMDTAAAMGAAGW